MPTWAGPTDTAIQAGHHLDDYDLYWLEEPVVCEDFEGYQRIAAALKNACCWWRESLYAV